MTRSRPVGLIRLNSMDFVNETRPGESALDQLETSTGNDDPCHTEGAVEGGKDLGDSRDSKAATQKKAIDRLMRTVYGGSGEIRTHERFPFAGFQDRCNRPLCHASKAYILTATRIVPALWHCFWEVDEQEGLQKRSSRSGFLVPPSRGRRGVLVVPQEKTGLARCRCIQDPPTSAPHTGTGSCGGIQRAPGRAGFFRRRSGARSRRDTGPTGPASAATGT